MTTLQQRIALAAHDLPWGWKSKLSKKCKVSGPSVSDWVSGETATINMEHLFDAAEFFNVSPKWLGTGKGPMRPIGDASWPFDEISLQQWEAAPERVKGKIEGYAQRLISESAQATPEESPQKIAA